MIEFRLLIAMPILIGIILFFLPETMRKLKGLITIIAAAATLVYAFIVFSLEAGLYKLGCLLFPSFDKYFVLNLDGLSKLIVLFIGIFGFLYSLYSLGYIKKGSVSNYESYFLITLGASFGAALADHMFLFITLWGLLGLTLYKLIKGDNEESAASAKKTLILIGASDSILIMGIGFLYAISNTLIFSEVSIPTTFGLANIAFICLLIASLTKAGAIPFHTWIPDYAQNAPASSSALLPASLDKLLGIYFLARICMNIFTLSGWSTLLLMILGSVTIIAAVMMALVQHNYKRLLGYHAVSQVGYMITGLGLGTPLGIAAGLFHMINNTLYKGGLFLASGSVEKQTGKHELNELSGLSKYMPLTFIAALIFALSISGIPPLNGFYSKWMIYTGIIEFGGGADIASKLWPLWLALAVIGSALTLASFIKFISGIYLGKTNPLLKKIKEVNILMWLPQIILAVLCIVFGILAIQWVLPMLFDFAPLSEVHQIESLWNSLPVAILVIVSLLLGFLIYLIGNIKKFRRSDSFIGGEKIQEDSEYSPLEFYKTISSFKFFNFFYDKAKKKWFDIYDLGKGLVLGLNTIFSKCHTGVLSTYIMWVIFGLVVLLVVLIL